MNALLFYLEQESKKVAAECYSNAQRVRCARTMREVRNLSEIHVRPELKHIPSLQSSVRDMDRSSTDRMKQLLDAQLENLSKCENEEDFKKVKAQLIQNEWVFLRGKFSDVYRRAEAESEKLFFAHFLSAPDNTETLKPNLKSSHPRIK